MDNNERVKKLRSLRRKINKKDIGDYEKVVYMIEYCAISKKDVDFFSIGRDMTMSLLNLTTEELKKIQAEFLDKKDQFFLDRNVFLCDSWITNILKDRTS